MKRFIAFILCLLLCCFCLPTAFAGNVTITNVNEAFALVRDTELIAIYDATLYEDGVNGRQVYYVVCKGLDFSEFDPNEPRSYANAIRIGLSDESNTYVKALVSAVTANVPEGADVVFVGHSMGGMVIEQAIANKTIKKKYNVLYSLAIGSPFILTSSTKEGKLQRIVDKLDPICFLSIPLLANPYMGDVAIESSGLVPLIHFRSYESGTCWKAYDALGHKNGKARVELNKLIYD